MAECLEPDKFRAAFCDTRKKQVSGRLTKDDQKRFDALCKENRTDQKECRESIPHGLFDETDLNELTCVVQSHTEAADKNDCARILKEWHSAEAGPDKNAVGMRLYRRCIDWEHSVSGECAKTVRAFLWKRIKESKNFALWFDDNSGQFIVQYVIRPGDFLSSNKDHAVCIKP